MEKIERFLTALLMMLRYGENDTKIIVREVEKIKDDIAMGAIEMKIGHTIIERIKRHPLREIVFQKNLEISRLRSELFDQITL